MILDRIFTVRTLLLVILFLVVCRPSASCSTSPKYHRETLAVSIASPLPRCGL